MVRFNIKGNNLRTIAEIKNDEDMETNPRIGNVFNLGAIPSGLEQEALKILNFNNAESGIISSVDNSGHGATINANKKINHSRAKNQFLYMGLNSANSSNFAPLGNFVSNITKKYTSKIEHTKDIDDLNKQVDNIIEQEEKFLGIFGGENITEEIRQEAEEHINQIEQEIAINNPEFSFSPDVKNELITQMTEMEKANILQTVSTQCGLLSTGDNKQSICDSIINPLENALNISSPAIQQISVAELMNETLNEFGSQNDKQAFQQYSNQQNNFVTRLEAGDHNIAQEVVNTMMKPLFNLY